MSTTNFSSGRSHTKSFQELLCSPSLVGGLQQQSSICFLAVNFLLFITAFSGNSLILVALHKESSLHPPSKLLYRCLATTDLLFGLITQPPYCYKLDVLGSGTLKPLSVRTWRCLHHRLCIVFSVFDDDDGHKREQTSRLVVGAEIQIVTLKRTYIIVTTFSVFYPCRLYAEILSQYNLFLRLPSYSILPGNITRIVHKDFSHSQISSSTSGRSTTAEPNKCTEHGAIQKGSIQCTVGAVSISCLLCTNMYSEYCDRSYQKIFISLIRHI